MVILTSENTLQNNIFPGLSVGQKIITLQRVPSTNDHLKALLSKSEPVEEGTVIMAVDQYAGRGQQENTWHSEPGKNLTASLLLKPEFLPPSRQFTLNIAVSLAVLQVLGPLLGSEVKVKWPNDMYVGNRKIGGILIENFVQGSRWKYAVVGIGINVNQLTFNKLEGTSCSIKQLLHADYDITQLLSDLCKAVGMQYGLLKSGFADQQRAAYLHQLYRAGEEHPFLIKGIPVTGKIVDVSVEGRLVIDFNGHVTDFGLKEIEFLIG